MQDVLWEKIVSKITKGGCIVRQFAKYDGTTWKNQPQELKDEIIAKCTTKKERRQPTQIDQYKIGHYSKKKGKMVNDNAQRTLDELRHEESTSSSSPVVICKNILHHISRHLKGCAIPERPRMTIQHLRNEVETEKRRADDAIEQNTAITAKVAAQESELNAVKDQMQILMVEIGRLSSLQGGKD